MILFSGLRPTRHVPSHSPELTTPLGRIGLRACLGRFDSTACLPDDVWESGATRAFSWHTSAVDLQLVISPFVPRLPAGRAVSEAHAVVWRFRPGERVDAPSFSCEWAADATWSEWDAASGQLLEAIEWSDPSTIIHVGTGDAEFYSRFAGRVPWLPARWTAEVFGGDDPRWSEFTFDYPPQVDAAAPTRARIVLPPVYASELCQVHFLIAWSHDSNPDDPSSWFAVEQDPSVFLPADA
jgi:hypothetical protein